jgi:hypothetical protein
MKPKSGLREIVAVMLAVSLNPPLHACDTATLTVFPSVLCKGDQATITASIPCNSTIEPAFRILGVDWDFDSDGTVDATTADLSVLHTFSTPGCDNVSVTVRGTNDASFGSYCATGSKEYSVAEVTASAPDLWYFNGATGPNYPLTVMLTVSAPDCQYAVQYVFNYEGNGRVDFDQGSAQGQNPATLVGMAASGPAPNDISVSIKFNGVPLPQCTIPLTVKTAKSIVCDQNLTVNTTIFGQGSQVTGYSSKMYYVGFDQFGAELPLSIGFNEKFTSDAVSDPSSPNENWPRGPEGGFVQPPTQLLDEIHVERSIPPPAGIPALSPTVLGSTHPLRCQGIDSWNGDLYCGSATPGEGVVVTSTAWQRKRAVARHVGCAPPSPACP